MWLVRLVACWQTDNVRVFHFDVYSLNPFASYKILISHVNEILIYQRYAERLYTNWYGIFSSPLD